MINGFEPKLHRYPSLLRVWALPDQEGFPKLSTPDIMRAMEDLFRDEERRKTIQKGPVRPELKKLVAYIRKDKNLMSAWRRHNGYACSVFMKTTPLMESLLNGGRLYPWELAHMALPDTVAYDPDVVSMHAKAQGLSWNDVGTFASKSDVPINIDAETIGRGLEKLLTDSWFRFALVAPYMLQFGTGFDGVEFHTEVARVEYLLDNPYQATEGEVQHIAQSPAYQVAWERMTNDIGLAKAQRTHPPPGPVFYERPGPKGGPRTTPLEDWCIWKKGRQKLGGV